MKPIQLFLSLFWISTAVVFSQNSTHKKYSLSLIDAFPNLSAFTRPVFFTHANDNSGRVFVVEQAGRIWTFQGNDTTHTKKLFLDIRARVDDSGNEMGLLSVAFHPNFSQNKFFFLNYTAGSPMRTVISRFKISANDSTVADSTSEYKILEINQPYSNHNGGLILFGPDGYLYIGMGDGGSGGDPQNNAQNLQSLLGKMLRINIDSATAPLHYAVPPDNPFVDSATARKEIWTTGMRNPWRFCFDPVTNFLYCADVGQNSWEEIDILQKGKNYGWRCYEGNHSYNPANCGNSSMYTMPIKEYPHSDGQSITGGYVYRGTTITELLGAYIYADYVNGRIWFLRYNGSVVTEEGLLLDSPYNISSFGEDEQKELYLCAFNGRIYKFQSPTGIKEERANELLKNSFSLSQNFPNPFNPKTTIHVSLSSPSVVSLNVYDILGKEIASLLNNENKDAGKFKVEFDATTVPNGIYFYRLSVTQLGKLSFNETKKFVVMK